jgi:hypothetical protein
MRSSTYVTLGIGLVVALLVAGSIEIFASTDESESSEAAAAAVVEHIDGTDLSRVKLTELGARRIGLETAAVARGEGGTTTVPYSALLYDQQGATWVYTTAEPLTFQRAPVEVANVAGESVVLQRGLEPGTQIATVGVAELYGSEFEISH